LGYNPASSRRREPQAGSGARKYANPNLKNLAILWLNQVCGAPVLARGKEVALLSDIFVD
jgi:hypothetical protein